MQTRDNIEAGVEQIHKDLELEPGQLHMDQACRAVGCEALLATEELTIDVAYFDKIRHTVEAIDAPDMGVRAIPHHEKPHRKGPGQDVPKQIDLVFGFKQR